MPELPEVETTRRILEPYLLGQTIRQLSHSDPARYRHTELAHGRRVLGTARRGKYILWQLEGGLEAVIHLGMTGGFRFEPHSHTRLTVELSGRSLYYTDPRRFGKWWVVEAGNYRGIDLLGRMGPEPLSEAFTLSRFQQALARTRRRIKEVLLGQEAVAGIGNIYADESLWQSRIHPERPANTLSPAEVKRLHRAIRDVIGRAVAAGGSTLSDNSYQQPTGEPGYFQLEHNAYGRAGERCKRSGCTGKIIRIVVGGRGSHLCPNCQRLARAP
ncbi:MULTISPECIES: DNA-formamidopyrimidine glycosylase [unclassified Meiothermus]|uniref:DNA-formamidopyrimidine glycosylase n=1 Tax=unclassified Meiothermus TaxID=370471 RepID=UPI000D7CDC59|nr:MULTISPECIES: DNA-formamidopyrimidine glycosylase [unclassified Meiothermus]PZA08815.1 DNA-formamidopyrimidine glycosylase [Meiothermus sp. Pnk-1]RYM40562.1 DNA-formamidopyrimidine glycosylase [Meiothermus sp. PNK-Is4]